MCAQPLAPPRDPLSGEGLRRAAGCSCSIISSRDSRLAALRSRHLKEGQKAIQHLRTITLEEHYATPDFMNGPGRDLKAMSAAATAAAIAGAKTEPRLLPARFANLAEELTDIGSGRIAAMDAAGIDVQVLSLTSPGTEQLSPEDSIAVARNSNDSLAGAIEKNPTRLAGFAAIPTPAPVQAADELERTIREYRFKGALINGHCRGRYLDDKFFWPIFERAQELGVPIYLHPTRPPQRVVETYFVGNFPREVSGQLSIAAWGWHIETAVHVVRIIASGVFDAYPKLQLVIGHLGEGLPFMLQRLEQNLPIGMTRLERTLGSYLRENVHYTLSGFNFLPPFLNLLMEVGADRIMFSTDHPYASMKEARDFLDRIPVSPAERERIAHGNAERLFRF
jgi:predicted TIM-barrel fold metal-dependent hydrolase